MIFPESVTVISDEVSQDLAVVSAFLREFRLPGLELRSVNGRAFLDLTHEDVVSIAARSQAEGWKVFGCATPVFKCDLDNETAIRTHREIFKRSLEVAHKLDCNLLRVFTFLRRIDSPDSSLLAYVAGHLEGLIELSAGSGIRLGIENEHSCMVATAAELQVILEALPQDRIGAIWDPCNVLYVPDTLAATPAESAQLVPRLFHVHVKDSIRRRVIAGQLAAAAVPVGAGEVGWRSHFEALQSAGYRGLLSLETHWRSEQVDERLLHLPAGHAFSHGGDAASRVCLQNLRGLLETR
jgi:L-ribulose-5-phosphate 3-epimerase